MKADVVFAYEAVSKSAPPSRTSSPAPPTKVSLPPPPERVSTPAPPLIESEALVPSLLRPGGMIIKTIWLLVSLPSLFVLPAVSENTPFPILIEAFVTFE
ncbi:MAG: hypothetical protein EBV69_07720 [Oxalobacteraceae bacterium]|nr:hypothetical protein [Oxalobacteraceae bacterium]